MALVLIPLPALDFDPTEVAVSWLMLTTAGHDVRFATPDGAPAQTDDMMITGEGLDPWGFIPGVRRLTAMGRIMRADQAGREAYRALVASAEFRSPVAWDAAGLDGIDGLLLPGGHRARGMQVYLESAVLQQLVVAAFRRELPVAAVCHGVLLAARSIDPETGRSVLYGRRTTALTWSQEKTAATIGRVARWWDPRYYRTYPDGQGQSPGYMSVQSEVTRALEKPTDFVEVDPNDPEFKRKTDGRHRDRPDDSRPAHVVEDGTYVSARWPGDVHTFARRWAAILS